MNDYDRIATAIEFISENVNSQPSLNEIANQVNLSPYHFQRLFTRWAGISPKQFLQSITINHAKELLDDSLSVLNTTNELGLSSSARLHDHFVTIDAITPGEYKSKGTGLKIKYGIHSTPFGYAFIAITDRGICKLAFIEKKAINETIYELEKDWHNAMLIRSDKDTKSAINNIFYSDNKIKNNIRIFLKGTNFQINIWRALLMIPEGKLSTYGALSRYIGKPKSFRAVGNAVGANPIAYIIPCHRVIRASGAIGGYRWGETRKRAMLSREFSNTGIKSDN